MIILDTNVVSELLKPRADRTVVEWMNSGIASTLYITTITEAELYNGISLLPRGQKKQALATAVDVLLEGDFAHRVLPFDRAAAHFFGEVMGSRRRGGRPTSPLDAQIAAIAKSHDASLATRNVADFELCGIEVINPWGQ